MKDRQEPGVEFFVRGDLVQEAAVDEPDLAGVDAAPVHPQRRAIERLAAGLFLSFGLLRLGQLRLCHREVGFS